MRMQQKTGTLVPRLIFGLGTLFVLAQLVPYGRAHANPPAKTEPQWDSPATRQLFERACADCHSNHTVWPWYSKVAPVSWWLQNHVDEGREKFNVNAVGFGRDSEHAAEEVQDGSMPPAYYTPMHPAARLSEQERSQLVKGLAATFGQGKASSEGKEDAN